MSQMKRLCWKIKMAQGSNVHFRTQPENKNGSKYSYENSATDGWRSLPNLNASDLWFGNNANDPPQDHQRANDYSKNPNPEDIINQLC